MIERWQMGWRSWPRPRHRAPTSHYGCSWHSGPGPSGPSHWTSRPWRTELTPRCLSTRPEPALKKRWASSAGVKMKSEWCSINSIQFSPAALTVDTSDSWNVIVVEGHVGGSICHLLQIKLQCPCRKKAHGRCLLQRFLYLNWTSLYSTDVGWTC